MITIIKKSFIPVVTILLLVISILAEMQVEVAEANPFFIYHQIDPLPGAIPPIITIVSPQNSQEYYSENIIIDFNVSKPKLDTYNSAIIEVDYTLDDNTVQAFSIWRGGSSSNKAVPQFDITVTSPSLSTGRHQLSVYAQGVVYADNMNIFFMNSSSSILFAIGTKPFQPSPTPTTSSLIPTPTSIEVVGNDSSIISNSELILAVIVVVGMGLVIGLLLKTNYEVKR